VTVDLPDDAGQGQGTYIVARDGGCSDFLHPTEADTQTDEANVQGDTQTAGTVER
jgi:hypothetical protein